MTTTQAATAPVLAHARAQLGTLRPSDRRVAELILERPTEVQRWSVSELAAEAGVSDATVVHAAKQLGFSGYQELKFELSRQIAGVDQLVLDRRELGPGSPVQETLAEVLRKTHVVLAEVIDTVDADHLDAAARALANAGRIEVLGATSSYALALDAAYRLATIGLPVGAPQEGPQQTLASMRLGSGDVCLVISHTGATHHIVDAARDASAGGACVVAITSFSASPLVDVADVPLIAGGGETAARIVAMTSRFAHLAVIDALYLAVALLSPERAQATYQFIETRLTSGQY